METQIEKRKLAAVMFADIEGYTALFQKNETKAFQIVEQHHKTLKEVAIKHKGHVVKFYGDGSLTLFPSVIEATRCAMDLQMDSARHEIPLRIGIHMGEMIEKDHDVYGDAVNIASRIQALGVSGSILVSNTVVEELKNHPDITTKSLGHVNLKNIKNSIEVFALTSEGLRIPYALPGTQKKKLKMASFFFLPLIILIVGFMVFKDKLRSRFTQFGDECIIIPSFTSYTSSDDLEHFGTMASFELTKALSETGKRNIIPYNTMLLYSNANVASFTENPSLAKKLGAEIEIRGTYTLEGKNLDTLRVSISILDLSSNRLFQIPIQDVTCSSSDKRECLEELKNILVGYWKSKEDDLFHFTTDSAYIPFQIAKNRWADPENKKEIKSYLIKALQEDPKFMDAWFLLLNLFHNGGEYKSGIDTIAVIEDIVTDMDQRQKEYLGYYKADFQGNNSKAFNSFLKEYNLNSRDLFINTTGMVMAMEYVNDPMTAIQMFNLIEPDSLNLSTCTYCVSRFNLALKGYMALSNLEQAKKLVSQIKPHAFRTTHFISLLKYYIIVKDTVSINEVIRTASKVSKSPDEEPYLFLMTARMATTHGDIILKDRYVKKAIQSYKKIGGINLARCYLLDGRLSDAKQLYLSNLANGNIDPSIYAYLGIIYAKEGDVVSANRMVEKLEAIKEKFDFGYTPYYQGRIKAHLGEVNAAIEYLKIALEEGIRFLPISTFLNDPDLIGLNHEPEYLKLLARNRQP